MFWLEERHTLIFRPAFSICFPLLLSPPTPAHSTWLSTQSWTCFIYCWLSATLVISVHLLSSGQWLSMDFSPLPSIEAVLGLLLAFLSSMYPLSTGLEASLLLLPMVSFPPAGSTNHRSYPVLSSPSLTREEHCSQSRAHHLWKGARP